MKQPIFLGVDEVGRGPLAGPVVSAAVVLSDSVDKSSIKDSKSIAKSKIIKIAEQIKKSCNWNIGIATVEEIEKLNILQATMLSMKRAISGINQAYDIILVDGNQNPLPNQANVKTMVKGDKSDVSIAAASILAKAFRDKLMSDLHLDFPLYGWNRNSGYGTKEHTEAIKKHGITKHHRKLFLRKIICS